MNNGCKPQNIGIIDRLDDHFIITWFFNKPFEAESHEQQNGIKVVMESAYRLIVMEKNAR